MKYRPSKGFVWSMVTPCPLVSALWLGVLPEVRDMEVRAVPGEMVMPGTRNGSGRLLAVSAKAGSRSGFRWSMDWLEESYDNLMSWEHNPWKRKPDEFGHHYFNLHDSEDPKDKAKIQELLRLAEAWHKRLIERYPELAIALRDVPDERNGFLKWLEFCEKLEAGKPRASVELPFPAEIKSYLESGAWNSQAAAAWLAQNKALLDEIRAIGLLPDRSVNGLPVDRSGFISARLAKSCGEALMVDARLSAEQGNVAAALESIRAANGLANHIGEVEVPSLLAETVQILMEIGLQKRVLTDILPAVPAGQLDLAQWESVLNMRVSPPAEFGHLMKSEWSVTSRYFLLPMLLNGDDPRSPSDGAQLVDYYSTTFASLANAHVSTTPTDLGSLEWPSLPSDSHLSRSSRQALPSVFLGANGWRTGWERAQSVYAMNQAAFSILKGQPVPKDPVYGMEYRWDPRTRVLSPPDTEAFRGMKMDSITLPKL